MRSPRPVDLARLGLGLALATRPQAVLRLAPAPSSDRTQQVVRVLGARYLLQAAGGYALDRPWVPALDAGAELLHAASMLALAAYAPRHRRLALLSGAVAATFAAADLRGDR